MMINLYEIMGYIIAAKDKETAIEIAYEESGLGLDEYVDYEYKITELPESYWNKEMFILDLYGDMRLDINGEPITQTYNERFKDLGYEEGVLSEEF